MDKTLSQQDIDILINAVSTGGIKDNLDSHEETSKIKNYDFRRPNKLSKEHIRALELIHENYARIASNYLSSQVGSNVKVKLVSTEQTTYEEFIKPIPNPTLLSIFHMTPLNGTIMMEINPQFGFQMIDSLCGGSAKHNQKIRAFTEIEKSIVMQISNDLIMGMKSAWEDTFEVSPELDTIETNPQLNQMMSPNESIVLFSFNIDMLNTVSKMNICLPYIAIEQHVEKLYSQNWFTSSNNSEKGKYEFIIKNRLMNSKVNLSVLLGKTDISISEFMDLQVGDVLKLNKKANIPLKMNVEDRMHYYVQPGIYNKKLSVQVVEIVEKDVDDDE